MVTIYAHIEGVDNAVMDLDEMPKPTDNFIVGRNPRKRDGKELPYVLGEVNTIIIPMSRIIFIEILTREEEEEFITAIRE
jgi:hypothetical protein